MDLLESTMKALDIKNSPTFEDVVKNMPVIPQGKEVNNGNTK